MLGCFGDFGAEAGWFLYILAFLEQRQDIDLQDKAGLPPLPLTDRLQFRACCFRQSSTRISAALRLPKATVMPFAGISSLPAPAYLSHVNLARNCPGPAAGMPRRPALRCRLNLAGLSTGQLPPFTPSLLPLPCCVCSLPFSVDVERAP